MQGVHVKNRCAWLNHSEKPQVFVDLVRQYPNIRLWFSGADRFASHPSPPNLAHQPHLISAFPIKPTASK